MKEQEQYYLHLLQHLKSLDSPVAFDIGANEGFVTETLLKKGLRVVAAEPDPQNIRVLKARFGGNGRFRLFPVAAGAQKGKEKLYPEIGGGALSTLNPKWKNLVELADYRVHSAYGKSPVEVDIITLDELIGESGLPCFIKIDVEGYESSVMRGLTQQVPLLVFEANMPEFLTETLDCIRMLYEIDPGVLFNYSSFFRLGLDQPLPYNSFRELLLSGLSVEAGAIDVICYMSNYPAYYLNNRRGQGN